MIVFLKIIKRKAYFICFLLFYSLQHYSQTVSREDTLFIDRILSEAKLKVEMAPDQAIQLVNRAMKIAQQKQYNLGIANSYNVLGNIYKRKASYKDAILYYNLAKKIAEQEHLKSVEGIVLYNLGTVYEDLSSYDNAFKATEAALDIKRKLNDSVGIARCYRKIGQYQSYKKNYPLSIGYFKKALDIELKLNKKSSAATTLNSMGVVYTDAKMYPQALTVLQESKRINENQNDSVHLAHTYGNLGFCYDGMLKEDSAEHYYLKALKIWIALNFIQNKVTVLNNLGELYLKQNKLPLSEKYLTEALVLAEEINSIIDLKYIQNNLAELYRQMGNYEKAYYFKEQYIVSSDSLMNEEKTRTIEEISIRFETKEIEERNNLLQKDIDLQKTKIQQRNYFIFGILIFTVLAIVILFLYIRQNKYKTQKQNLDIEQKLLQIQMNPHFIFNSLQAIQSFILTNKQKESAGYLSSFSRLMRLILENSKHEFISLDKEIDTLTYYLELQQLRFKDVFVYHITIDPAIDKEFILMPPMLLQPFIENAIEHGFRGIKEKGILKFNVLKQNNQLVIEVIDNGTGIEKTRESKQSGESKHISYALEIINKRIEILNQNLKTTIRLSIVDLSSDSGQECGTRISLFIPNINKLK